MIKYFVGGEIPPVDAFHIVPERSLHTGERDFVECFGAITSLERDLLVLAASIFAADRATKRGEREELSRRIQISVPVVNVGRLQPLSALVEDILRSLSNDAWRIEFRQSPGEIEKDGLFSGPSHGKTLLFSGGLDSLAAAIYFFQTGDGIQLVSHITRNTQTRRAQTDLAEEVRRLGIDVTHRQFFVSSQTDGSSGLDHDVENSQRTRSFVFLILGALSGRRSGYRELVLLAENGQMAIHLPLTNGRIGAFSTHTAHPDVLAKMEQFLSAALAIPMSIRNPFVHMTKGEVVEQLVENFPGLVAMTESCWKNTRLPQGATHCGECIPCYVRRISLEKWGKDPTAYAEDPWLERSSSTPTNDTGRRNLVDLVEFIHRIEHYSDDEIMNEWPELYSENLNPGSVISMYRRFAAEARSVLERYPNVRELLQ